MFKKIKVYVLVIYLSISTISYADECSIIFELYRIHPKIKSSNGWGRVFDNHTIYKYTNHSIFKKENFIKLKKCLKKEGFKIVKN